MTGLRTILLWIGVSAALLLFGTWSALVRWADSNPNMAAWVQAVGSILAVLASGAFILWQNRLQEKQADRVRRLAKAQSLETAFQLAAYSAGVCNKVSGHLSTNANVHDPYFIGGALAEIKAVGAAFEKIDLDVFDSYADLHGFMLAVAIRNAIEDHLQTAYMQGPAVPVGARLASYATALASELRKAVSELRHVADASRQA